MIEHRLKIAFLCFISTIILILFTFLYLKSNQIDKVSFTEKVIPETQKAPNTPFVLKDISNDPRFDDKNFINYVSIIDIDPCLDPYGEGFDSCTKNTYSKEITSGIKVVINLRSKNREGKERKIAYLSFSDKRGSIQSIPEIPIDNYLQKVAFLNDKYIFLMFSCDECTTRYAYFDGSVWRNGWGWKNEENLIDRTLPAKKLYFGSKGPPYDIRISDKFIKIEEAAYCCDAVFSDILNVIRLKALGPYSFLLDRKTLKPQVIGFRTSTNSKTFEYKQTIVDYLNNLLNEDDIDFQKEIASWKNYIEFDGMKIPYPNKWTAEIFYSENKNKRIKYLTPSYKVTGRFFSLDFAGTCNDCYLGTELDEKKGIDFEMLKTMNIIQGGLKEYLKQEPQNR